MRQRWLRPVLILLAIPNLVAGLWAILAPQNWFENFPGWAPHLVAAIPPFNDHLATDAGAGLLAAGVVTALAVVVPRRDIVIAAMVGVLAFSLPHTLFHVFSPADLMTTSENVTNAATLVVGVIAAAVVLVAAIADKKPQS